MKLKTQIVSLAGAVMLLAGCGSFEGQGNIDEMNAMQFKGSPFQVALANGYKKLANQSWNDEMHWRAGDDFAVKSIKAGRGEEVLPFNPERWWTMPDDKLKMVQNSYAKLMAYITEGAPQIAPETTAKAQVSFDCWVEEQDENWETAEIKACRDNFDASMKMLEKKMGLKSDTYMVFFEFNKSDITKEAQDVLYTIYEEYKNGMFDSITVAGHTDSVGSKNYNMNLSVKRAQAVSDALVKMGVPATMISSHGDGTAHMLVPTKPGVREPANRRVMIQFK